MHMQAATIETTRKQLPSRAADSDVIARVRGEFREMPGMRLTFDQAVRLWALDRRTCETVLDRLVTVGYLVRDDRGHYRKAHGGY
jgi:hypothetical protein